MPDEAITAPSADAEISDATAADTPTEAPGNAGQGAANEPDEQGAMLRADYTRKTQQLAEDRRQFEAQQAENERFRELVQTALVQQDEEAIEQLLGDLGYEFGEDDVGEYADPEVSRLKSQLDELNEWKNEQQAEAAARDNALHIEREFHRLGLEGWDESNPAHDAIIAFAFANDDPANPNAPTNVEAGYKQYTALRDHIIEELKESKRAPESDQFGSPASAVPVENASLEDRVKLAMERNGF